MQGLEIGLDLTARYSHLASRLHSCVAPPDTTPYTPYKIPEPLMDEVNVAHAAPLGKESARYTWVADAVPMDVMNKITWAYRYGSVKSCPKSLGRAHLNPCGADDSGDSAAEIAKAKGTIIALREIAAGRRMR